MKDASGKTWIRSGEDCTCEDGRAMRITQDMADAYILSVIDGMDAETARLAALDAVIGSDDVIAQMKAMTGPQFDAWWAANVTNAAQAIGVLKRVTRIVIRRVL